MTTNKPFDFGTSKSELRRQIEAILHSNRTMAGVVKLAQQELASIADLSDPTKCGTFAQRVISRGPRMGKIFEAAKKWRDNPPLLFDRKVEDAKQPLTPVKPADAVPPHEGVVKFPLPAP